MKNDNDATGELDLEEVINQATDRGFDEHGEPLEEGEEPVVIDEEESNDNSNNEVSSERKEGEDDEKQAGDGSGEEGEEKEEPGKTDDADEAGKEDNDGKSDDADKKDTDENKEEELSNEEFAESITKDRTKKRFTDLINDKKEVDTKYEDLEQRFGAIQQSLASTGCTNHEIGQLLDIGEALKKGEFDKAMPLIQPMLDMIAQQTGKPFGSANPLSQHQDLQDQVDDMTLTEEQALQVARGRNIESRQKQVVENNNQQQHDQHQQQQGQDQAQAQFNQSVRDVDAWAVQTAKKDPDFERYEKQISNFIKSDIESGNLHPSKILQATKNYYKQLTDFADGITGRKQSPGTNTLRGKGDTRQHNPAAPKDIGSAIDQGMSEMYPGG